MGKVGGKCSNEGGKVYKNAFLCPKGLIPAMFSNPVHTWQINQYFSVRNTIAVNLRALSIENQHFVFSTKVD